MRGRGGGSGPRLEQAVLSASCIERLGLSDELEALREERTVEGGAADFDAGTSSSAGQAEASDLRG